MNELFVSDIHFPYEDKAAWNLFLSVAREIRPTWIVLGGDILDFYPISRFDKDPQRLLSLQEEIEAGKKALGQLRDACPSSRILFRPGNHERRLEKFLWRKVPELSQLPSLQLPELLSLSSLEVAWDPSPFFRLGQLSHLHGDEFGGGSVYPARNLWAKAHGNLIFGHYHKIQVHFSTSAKGEMTGAWANGCLCSLSPEYSILPQWQQGFSLIDYCDSGLFFVSQIPLLRIGKTINAVVEGRLFSESLLQRKERKK